MLKEKVRLKEDNFLQFKQQIKKQMLEYSIHNHKLKRNEMRARVNNNKIRLGEFSTQRRVNDTWVEGKEMREIREKL